MSDKLYICVLDSVPDHMTPVLVAHAVLRHHISSNTLSNERYLNWLAFSFRKCVVRVNQKEFEKIRKLPDVVDSWENTVQEGSTSCLTVIAHSNEHNVLKFAKLWKPIKE